MSRLTLLARRRWASCASACLLLAALSGTAAGLQLADGLEAEVVAVGIPRPVQVAIDGSGRLVILSHGSGAAAAELYRLDLGAGLPLPASRTPPVVIPFAAEPRKAAFGSLAVDPRSGDLFLGEENGNRIYRMNAEGRLTLFAIGLNHLLGGSTLAFDRHGRLVVLDYVSPEEQLRSETPPPASFEGLSGDAYHGPLVIRLDPEEDVPPPRRLDLLAPILPRGRPPARAEPLFRFIAAATSPSGDVVLLNSVGEISVLGPDGLRPMTRLPAGHYHRTNMAVGPDGGIFVSTGFQIRQIFRITAAGEVTLMAWDLGDPEGIAVDAAGNLYVVENALHRVVRIGPFLMPPRASPP